MALPVNLIRKLLRNRDLGGDWLGEFLQACVTADDIIEQLARFEVKRQELIAQHRSELAAIADEEAALRSKCAHDAVTEHMLSLPPSSRIKECDICGKRI